MGRKRLHGQLIGIRLLPESYSPLCLNTNQLNEGKIIGTVLISIEGTTCSQLRQAINKYLDVPKEFCFLNSAGWPFDTSWEDKICVVDCLTSNVVSIQRKHAKLTRIGIKLLEGPVLGFIYLNFGYEISHVRSLINSELGDQFEINETFQFFDNNLWPVRRKQENELSVWDLVVNNCITLAKKQVKRNLEEDEIKADKKFKSFRNSIDVTSKERVLNSQSILISYVHREATPYAQDLKQALKTIGFKDIFLDVDDIPAGGDWQDVISLAVNKCSIFIPLVTSSYGETRWTNREAKLADDREKLIIPVSFVDKWPPDQLAIQFLTLQYIPWKTSDEIDGGNFSGHSDAAWNQKSVLRVANQIKKLCSDNEVSTPDSASLLDDKPSKLNFTLNFNGKPRTRAHAAEKIFIVVSAHSKQQEFVEKNITKMLEEQGYHVWNTMNLCDCDETSFSPIEDSHLLNSPLNSPMFENSCAISNIGHSLSNEKSLKRSFKEKVKAAKLVVLVFSEDYVKSSICCQQAFYCEQRKKNIVIKYGNFQVDSTLLNLYPEQEMIAKENWECLKYKIIEKLNHDYETSYWNSVQLLVTKLKVAIDTSMAIYIIGASDKINKNVEEFCRNLGSELAKVKKLSIATDGSKGVGDIVGRNFCEEQEIMNKGQSPKVFHIIPQVNSSIHSNDSSLFDTLPYGKTLNFGVSTANRDDIVANAFKLCLLIAGEEDSACLAEKFLFNDCTVIPVLHVYKRKCFKDSITKFEYDFDYVTCKSYFADLYFRKLTPEDGFKDKPKRGVPDNVDERDWNNLKDKYVNPENRAKTVKRIICTILNI